MFEERTISDHENKITQKLGFGDVSYSSCDEIDEDDLLRLEYVRKIEFCDKFNNSIDELPDNISDIKLGKDFFK